MSIFNHRTHGTLEPNLLHWTRDSLILLSPTIMKDYHIAHLILFILQISLTVTQPVVIFDSYHLPYYYLPGIAGMPTLFLLLDYGYSKSRHRQRPLIDAKKLVFTFIASISIGLLSFASHSIHFFPSLNSILLVVVLTPVWWVNASRIYYSRQRVVVARGM